MGNRLKRVFIAIGSNLSDREKNIKKAKSLMGKNGIKIVKTSSIIETEPYGLKEQPFFLNCVVECETALTPEELLRVLQSIEKELGRIRKVKWGPRTIDLDIIFYGNMVINKIGLVIPHPDMQNRIFVLKPICEIAPYFIHPVLRKTVKSILKKLEEKNENSNLEC